MTPHRWYNTAEVNGHYSHYRAVAFWEVIMDNYSLEELDELDKFTQKIESLGS